MSLKRRRRTPASRVLWAMEHLSRYSLTSALIALSGCTGLPRQIAVAPDGKSVVVATGARGIALSGEKGTLVRIDLQTGQVTPISSETDDYMWISTAGDVTVCMNEDQRVALFRGGKVESIEQAGYPALDPQGRRLVYTRYRDQKAQTLVLRDLATGRETELGLPGLMAEFSPDGKALLFGVQVEGPEDQGERMQLFAVDLDQIAQAKPLLEVATQNLALSAPTWVGNQHILVQMVTPQTGDDPEVFLIGRDGTREAVTGNDAVDLLPQAVSPTEILYLRQAMDPQNPRDPNSGLAGLYLAEKVGDRWQHRSLGLSLATYALRGREVLAVQADWSVNPRPITATTTQPDATTAINRLSVGGGTEVSAYRLESFQLDDLKKTRVLWSLERTQPPR